MYIEYSMNGGFLTHNTLEMKRGVYFDVYNNVFHFQLNIGVLLLCLRFNNSSRYLSRMISWIALQLSNWHILTLVHIYFWITILVLDSNAQFRFHILTSHLLWHRIVPKRELYTICSFVLRRRMLIQCVVQVGSNMVWNLSIRPRLLRIWQLLKWRLLLL